MLKDLLKLLIYIPLLLLPLFIFSQEDPQDVSLDVLRAPSSPAGNMLGITGSQIVRPSDPTAFMASVQSATQNYSIFPVSYAVDLAPAWIFASDKIDLYDLNSNNLAKTIKQSFVFSLATNTFKPSQDVDSSVTQLATGIKLSLVRGKFSDQFSQNVKELQEILMKKSALKLKIIEEKRLESERYQELLKLMATHHDDPQIMIVISSEKNQLDKEFEMQAEESAAELTQQHIEHLENMKLTRHGFKLDLAGGLVWNFPNMQYTKGRLAHAGAWVTAGFEWPEWISLLGIGRYQLNPDQVIFYDNNTTENSDISTLDGGLRLIFNYKGFALSAEGIYRYIMNNQDVDPAWRYTINAEYDVGFNKKLTFVFGRDFDGTINKDGSLIVALNLLMGFGSKKNINKD